MNLLSTIGLLIMLQQLSFKQHQLQFIRVKSAYDEKEKMVKQYFTNKNLNYKGYELFIRAFKKEMKLEVWIKEKDRKTYTLLNSYDFCSSSGKLGPKRKEGDLQIPEGIYSINHFNPQSNFHLSLGINYPNAADKILSDAKHPGSAIYIHGNCVTVGCIPITDDKIKELYILAIEARNSGQEKIPVHIYPCKMDVSGMDILRKESGDINTIIFWENLQMIYNDFKENKNIRRVAVDATGKYVFEK